MGRLTVPRTAPQGGRFRSNGMACQVQLDGEEERGTAGSNRARKGVLKVSLECQFDQFVWKDIGGHQYGCRLSSLTGRTHPCAEHRAVRGLLVMRVMGFVRDGLRRSEASHRKQAEDQEQSKRLLYQPRCHSVR